MRFRSGFAPDLACGVKHGRPYSRQQNASSADAAAAFAAAISSALMASGKPAAIRATAGYQPGEIAEVRDLDGDGQPEAIITEASAYCFGATEVGYWMVSRQPDGAWELITEGAGWPTVLASTGEGGWPDLEIGGPGFCFPVERWNGQEYVLDRHQYDGAACQPDN